MPEFRPHSAIRSVRGAVGGIPAGRWGLEHTRETQCREEPRPGGAGGSSDPARAEQSGSARREGPPCTIRARGTSRGLPAEPSQAPTGPPGTRREHFEALRGGDRALHGPQQALPGTFLAEGGGCRPASRGNRADVTHLLYMTYVLGAANFAESGLEG